MKNRKQIDNIIRHMNRKPTDHKKEGYECKCGICGNIQEYTEEFECENCGNSGNIERSLIKYLKETK